MKVSLMVLNAGKASGQTIPITTAQFVIGRDPKCNLRPASAMISKQHCAVITKDGRVYLKDFDSTNGTFLNDQPVKGAVVLKNSDVVKVGPLSFKVVLEGQPAVNKPTPPPQPKEAVADEAAALLLALDDESGSGEPMVSTTEDSAEVPGGSTIMEIPAVSNTPPAPAETTTAEKPPEKPTPKPPEKKPQGDTAHLAAQAILDRYKKGRRPS